MCEPGAVELRAVCEPWAVELRAVCEPWAVELRAVCEPGAVELWAVCELWGSTARLRVSPKAKKTEARAATQCLGQRPAPNSSRERSAGSRESTLRAMRWRSEGTSGQWDTMRWDDGMRRDETG
jgi:hypothetical protein